MNSWKADAAWIVCVTAAVVVFLYVVAHLAARVYV